MDLTRLLSLIHETPAYKKLVTEIAGQKNTRITLIDAAKPYFISALHQRLERPALLITSQPEKSKRIHEQISIWVNSPNVRLFPEPDSLPYQRMMGEAVNEHDRIRTLASLINIRASDNQQLIIASTQALMQKTTPYQDFAASCHTVKRGDEIDPFQLIAGWQRIGYRLESTVIAPGQIAHRGGITDIFPPTSELPVRMEFFGNTIESIRLFDAGSQRSQRETDSIFVTPAKEFLARFQKSKDELSAVLSTLDLQSLSAEFKEAYEHELALILNGEEPGNPDFYAPIFNAGNLLDYLPENALILLDEPDSIAIAAKNMDREAQEFLKEKTERAEIPSNFPRPYFTWYELQSEFNDYKHLEMVEWGATNEGITQLEFQPVPSYGGQLVVFIQKIKQFLRDRNRVIIVSHESSRLSELFNEANVIAPVLNELREVPQPGAIALLQGQLASGWLMENRNYLFTDAEIFGFVKERRRIRRRFASRPKYLTNFKTGDYIVHIEHGIGKFLGTTRMTADTKEKEYLVLQYAGGDKLYVPSDQIDRVGRYLGGGEEPPVPSRLGTQEWSRTKQRTKEEAEEMAKELLELYATREVIPGYAFSEDKVWQKELEASFPYVETPDQLKTIRDVKADMMQEKPMDRLVCGDSGYGKTEVAVRAAFKAILDGKQVAVLVPTTVLAEQHLITFRQRMEAFPVNIEVLSRFRSSREQSEVVEKLKSGAVDIVIGTHRLLQKDVAFKDLGLLVIDEEQRFGVSHKEYIKKLKKDAAVLTLSATPIPRTLHMSLVGVRDISMMETPPEDRLPVKSYVAQYDDRLVREAILRELERNGQVFFVHNRVQSIAMVAEKLKSLIPEAKIAIGHGQMPEEALETVMSDFARGKYDVLVCTTIIESGLDMPNVNTLIANRADRFGLSQLYQLRGRVGRGSELAYAYFLFDREKKLTHTAEKRLRTILEASELGAGFDIAMKDLEIRGAGTLLGTRQSGFISAVGFDLYCQLLSDAVEAEKKRLAGERVEKAREEKKLRQPGIDLPIPAFIPEDYVPDIETRLDLYQRLTRVTKLDEITDMERELQDRFGKLPQSVKNLLYAVRIKVLAAPAGIESVTHEPGYIVLTLFEGLRFDPKKLEPFMKYGIQLGANYLKLNSRRRLGSEWQSLLEEIIKRVG